MADEQSPDEETRRGLLRALGNVAGSASASGTERMVAAIAAAELRGYEVPSKVRNVVMWLTHRS